jgi:MerR HTH family regulatory protein
MQNSLLLSDVAAALDVPSGTLSQMLQRGGFSLPDADCRVGSGNWVHFTLADIATLALIRALNDFGIPIRTCSEGAQYIIEKGKVELTDIDRFIERWRDARFLVTRRDKGWSFEFRETWDIFFPGACVMLDVAQIVADAIERALESAAKRERQRRRA